MKAAGYIRVSTTEQATEGISLGNQSEKIRAYIKLHEMELVKTVSDEGLSAKSLKARPGAMEVLKMAREGRIKAVVVYKLDRLFRNAKEALDTATELNSLGVALHSVTESIDTASAMGRFFFTIMAACAEMERNLISERTRDALRHKKANGQVYSHAPYGYDDVDGALVENADEQGVVEMICNWHSDGWTYTAIAEQLNQNQVPTKGYGKKKRRQGARWYAQTVKNVIEAARQREEAGR